MNPGTAMSLQVLYDFWVAMLSCQPWWVDDRDLRVSLAM